MKESHIAQLINISILGLLSLVLIFVLFPPFIRLMERFKLTQKIRNEGLSGGTIFASLHAHKSGTPTMGGVAILIVFLLVMIITELLDYFEIINFSLISRTETYLPIFTLFFVGMLGMIDDWLNITEKSSQKGLSVKVKTITLLAFASLGAWWFTVPLERVSLFVPFIGDVWLGSFVFALFFIFIFMAVSNAVNITDGLDGLAGGLLMISYTVFGVLSYAYDLPILATFCFLISIILAGFLWYNVPPAQIYMGDTGSLALGATLGVIALMIDSIFILALVGFVFVLETVSVILQLFWKKYFGRKLFIIAPIHHHFEKKGVSETQIVMRFWLVGMGVGILGLILGLLRIT
jgi:phospho-N-acetylmuramoyl-pentapeptide-transferase